MAELDGTPIDELIARWAKWKVQPGDESNSTTASNSLGSALTKRKYRRQTSTDEEGANQDAFRSDNRFRTLPEYRDHSASPWLHFPHVELVFLLFAFEGAVAAGASALRESSCPWVIVAASAALVSRLVRNQNGSTCLTYAGTKTPTNIHKCATCGSR